MLIDALCRYYDILSKTGKLTADGYDYQDVSFMIFLTPDGKISNISDYTQEKDGKRVPRKVLLPSRSQKPGIAGNFIEHRPLYIFGLACERGEYIFETDKNKAQKSHTAFVEYNLKITEGIESDIVLAYRNFILNWKPEEETENAELIKIKNDYAKPKSYYCFALDGHPEILLHEDKDLLNVWEKIRSENAVEKEDAIKAFCPIMGEELETGRIHSKIKPIYNGASTGGSFVCVNNEAEESYKKEQAYNSNLSVTAAKKYTTALNYLIESKNHKRLLGDMTLLYWAMSENGDEKEVDIFGGLFSVSDKKANEKDVNNALDSFVLNARKGIPSDLSSFQLDENVEFYILGITPNNARISLKMLVRDKFGNILNNIIQHQTDIFIEGGQDDKSISMSYLLRQLVNPNSRKETVPSPAISLIMNSVLKGIIYPDVMFSTVVRMMKTGRHINSIRTGILKAYINRKSRVIKQKEEIKVALDLENKNEAYLCGRLFAVLENVQYISAPNLNRTIKDSYFSTACSNPSTVFPKLLKLAQYHLKSISSAKGQAIVINLNKEIGSIIEKLQDSFPTTLPLVEQGKFILGYYQQTQYRFKNIEKAKEESNKEEA